MTSRTIGSVMLLSLAFGGTAMVTGEAQMLVAATGRRTSLGSISSGLTREEPPPAFERGLHRLGMLIMRLTLLLALVCLAYLIGGGGRWSLDRRFGREF